VSLQPFGLGRPGLAAMHVPLRPIDDPRPLVLVGDDEPVVRNLMPAALSDRFCVLPAVDGRDALRMFVFMGDAQPWSRTYACPTWTDWPWPRPSGG